MAENLTGQFGRNGDEYRGRMATQGAEVRVPEFGTVLQEVSASAVLGVPRQGPFADFRIGAVRHLGAPPLFTPLFVTGDVSRDDQGLRMAARIQQGASGARLDMEARYRPQEGRGTLVAELAELGFAQDGLQPETVAPVLDDLRQVSGRIAARAHIELSQGEIAGSAQTKLTEMTFTTEQARVAGLSLDLTLDSLVPPGSPPGQRLTIAALDPGVPLRDIAIDFALLPVRPSAVHIERATLDFAGGQLQLDDVRLSASAARQEIPFKVRNLDIGLFFDTLGIEGLAADGKLEGRLPLVIEDNRLELRDGKLEAVAPGALSWRSDVVRKFVAQGGEAAEMVVRALENFHYDKLELSLSKTLDNEGQLTLRLEGRNPNYRDGQPFNFNINVEGNLTSLLKALAEAYRLSGRAFRGALEFSE